MGSCPVWSDGALKREFATRRRPRGRARHASLPSPPRHPTHGLLPQRGGQPPQPAHHDPIARRRRGRPLLPGVPLARRRFDSSNLARAGGDPRRPLRHPAAGAAAGRPLRAEAGDHRRRPRQGGAIPTAGRGEGARRLARRGLRRGRGRRCALLAKLPCPIRLTWRCRAPRPPGERPGGRRLAGEHRRAADRRLRPHHARPTRGVRRRRGGAGALRGAAARRAHRCHRAKDHRAVPRRAAGPGADRVRRLVHSDLLDSLADRALRLARAQHRRVWRGDGAGAAGGCGDRARARAAHRQGRRRARRCSLMGSRSWWCWRWRWS